MKVNEYKVLVEAVEQGIRYGIHRTFKYDDRPVGREELMARERTSGALAAAVINEICEWFEFDDRDDDGNLVLEDDGSDGEGEEP